MHNSSIHNAIGNKKAWAKKDRVYKMSMTENHSRKVLSKVNKNPI